MAKYQRLIDQMRLFLGIWPSPALKRDLESLVMRLRRQYPDWKWTSPENLHITLKFLGEVAYARDPIRLEEIKTTFSSCAASMIHFRLKLEKFGFFPAQGTPKVIWIGITTGGVELLQLASLIEQAGERVGFNRENRPFHPHLTIARAGTGVVIDNPEFSDDFCGFTEVNSFSLIESRLSPSGSVYHPLIDFPIGESKHG